MLDAPFDRLPEVLAVVGSALVLAGWLLLQLSQRRFIVKRYEERGLDRLNYFYHPVFLARSHPSWRVWLFTGHLWLMMILPLHRMRWNPFFIDVTRREEVLRHFSKWELLSTMSVLLTWIVGLMVGGAALVLRALR